MYNKVEALTGDIGDDKFWEVYPRGFLSEQKKYMSNLDSNIRMLCPCYISNKKEMLILNPYYTQCVLSKQIKHKKEKFTGVESFPLIVGSGSLRHWIRKVSFRIGEKGENYLITFDPKGEESLDKDGIREDQKSFDKTHVADPLFFFENFQRLEFRLGLQAKSNNACGYFCATFDYLAYEYAKEKQLGDLVQAVKELNKYDSIFDFDLDQAQRLAKEFILKFYNNFKKMNIFIKEKNSPETNLDFLDFFRIDIEENFKSYKEMFNFVEDKKDLGNLNGQVQRIKDRCNKIRKFKSNLSFQSIGFGSWNDGFFNEEQDPWEKLEKDIDELSVKVNKKIESKTNYTFVDMFNNGNNGSKDNKKNLMEFFQ